MEIFLKTAIDIAEGTTGKELVISGEVSNEEILKKAGNAAQKHANRTKQRTLMEYRETRGKPFSKKYFDPGAMPASPATVRTVQQQQQKKGPQARRQTDWREISAVCFELGALAYGRSEGLEKESPDAEWYERKDKAFIDLVDRLNRVVLQLREKS